MIQEAKTRFKTMVGAWQNRLWGFQLLLPQLDYVDMDGALLAEDIANGVTIKTEKSAILSETELEFFYYKHSWKSISFQTE
jgi:hypothetical protein